MENSYCYANINLNNLTSDQNSLINKLSNYSNNNKIVTYIVDRPLGDKKYTYDYEKALLVLIPKFKLLFINFGSSYEKDKFENYVEDFKEDLGYISDKFEYKQILGRPRVWKDTFFASIDYQSIRELEIEDILRKYRLENDNDIRKCELLISLLTGSINEAKRIGEEIPQNILEQIKRKIVLFDADQTRFIYQEPSKKRITIQGLAGTGKTELLLHKLKDLYLKDTDTKIVFTCFNKILADNLKNRIQEFFDFMKVEEQIKWDERLWTISSWGTKYDKNSGVYRYICDYYNIPFRTYSYIDTFEIVCNKALNEISEIEKTEPFEQCFDYMLIDESQDFPESFFKLCEKVTKKTIYVAGDIFQNIFDHEIMNEDKVSPDFLLNKCYRTDPRTLMFAHGIGMGLFDEKPLRWLTDKEWEICGYNIEKENYDYILSRSPLRRFEGIETKESVKIVPINYAKCGRDIIEILDEIRNENETVQPDDIAIIFLENTKENYELADILEILIKDKFNWEINKGYETKEKTKNCLFVSNKNNVKGLEFPFVICIIRNSLQSDLQMRNSLYMMLTRSFLKSYFLLPETDTNIKKYQEELKKINDTGVLKVKEPTEEEKEELIKTVINYNANSINKSAREIAEEIMDKYEIPVNKRNVLHNVVSTILKDNYSPERIEDVIVQNYNFL